ncbi:SCO family protein [Balneola vulgaris]|jgi:protein SCO1/2|uniref:SCO family protein n=1 Tax=Balneola vulgaris TaxID=287535 RepID=UPI00037F01E9|nr:SCO family protein [Balneola vulgaris]
MNRFALYAFITLAVLFLSPSSYAQVNSSNLEALQGVGIDEKLGDYIPLDATFSTVDGDSIRLGDLLEEGKPIILNPLYYDCPMLCGLVVDGVIDVVDELAWQPGKDYLIISFSIDPTENHELAKEYRTKYINKLTSTNAEEGWYFLTGKKKQIDAVIEATGFEYREVQGTGEYAHTAAIIMLAPDGKITRYLYGIRYKEFDVRNALFESADGEIGSTVNKILMYCYQYDPDSNSYVPVAMNIMKLGGLATLIILGIFLTLFWVRERRKKQSQNIDYN